MVADGSQGQNLGEKSIEECQELQLYITFQAQLAKTSSADPKG
jgi:hypothetical protein